MTFKIISNKKGIQYMKLTQFNELGYDVIKNICHYIYPEAEKELIKKIKLLNINLPLLDRTLICNDFYNNGKKTSFIIESWALRQISDILFILPIHYRITKTIMKNCASQEEKDEMEFLMNRDFISSRTGIKYDLIPRINKNDYVDKRCLIISFILYGAIYNIEKEYIIPDTHRFKSFRVSNKFRFNIKQKSPVKLDLEIFETRIQIYRLNKY